MQLTQRRPRRARPSAVCSRSAMEIDSRSRIDRNQSPIARDLNVINATWSSGEAVRGAGSRAQGPPEDVSCGLKRVRS